MCECPDWGPTGIKCADQPRDNVCRLRQRQQAESRQAERKRLAREIAAAFCGDVDPDTMVVPDWPQRARVRGGFTVAPSPQQVAPLWTFFLDAADAAMRAG